MAFPAAASPSPPSWSGFYIGVHANVSTGSSTWSDIAVASDSDQNLTGPYAHSSGTGIGGGLHAGYDHQLGALLIGVGGSLGYADLTSGTDCIGEYGDFHATCQTRVTWNGDASARIGWVPTPRALIYFKGGVAWAHAESQPAFEHGFDTTTGYSAVGSDRVGYLLGGGFEYAVEQHWTIGVEYNYQGFGTANVTFSPAGTMNDYNPPFDTHISNHFSTMLVRFTYRP
jgi:opacity protein-like surface antigen